MGTLVTRMGVMTESEFQEAWRESVAAALRMALAASGMSRAALARVSGVPARNLARYFDDKAVDHRDIPVTTLFDIAPHLDTTPEEIVAMARSVFEKRSGISWDQHVLAAKRGAIEPDETTR
jgi:transcriptional regulator with XRE-family HTH domain